MANEMEPELGPAEKHHVVPVFVVAFAVAAGGGWLAMATQGVSDSVAPQQLQPIVAPEVEPLAEPVQPRRTAEPVTYSLNLRQEVGDTMTLIDVVVEETPSAGLTTRTFTKPNISMWSSEREIAADISTDVQRLLDGAWVAVDITASGRPRRTTSSTESAQLDELLGVLQAACALVHPRFPVGDHLSPTDSWEWSFDGITVFTSVLGARGDTVVFGVELGGAASGGGFAVWDLERGQSTQAELEWVTEGSGAELAAKTRLSLAVE